MFCFCLSLANIICIQGLAKFIEMARPIVVKFPSTRNQTIVHHVSLELRDVGIENFQIHILLLLGLTLCFYLESRI